MSVFNDFKQSNIGQLMTCTSVICQITFGKFVLIFSSSSPFSYLYVLCSSLTVLLPSCRLPFPFHSFPFYPVISQIYFPLSSSFSTFCLHVFFILGWIKHLCSSSELPLNHNIISALFIIQISECVLSLTHQKTLNSFYHDILSLSLHYGGMVFACNLF